MDDSLFGNISNGVSVYKQSSSVLVTMLTNYVLYFGLLFVGYLMVKYFETGIIGTNDASNTLTNFKAAIERGAVSDIHRLIGTSPSTTLLWLETHEFQQFLKDC